ncbi:MAG TPA: alpha/beta hydrolase [Candidatus Limnocylindria bacterium]|nr:alpha/beta hydrolase [Candidatus Limnocylindria bacterium]
MRIRSTGDPEAPALVLIHGLSSSPRSWQRNLEALGAGRRLLIVELFPADAGPRFSIVREAAELRQQLDRETQPVTIIGHSLGGLIAITVAAEAPHLVKRLVLMSVPASRESQSIAAQLFAVASSGTRTDLRSIAVVAGTVLTANPVQLAAATRATVRADFAAMSAQLTMPCLLVWGAQDAIVPPAVGHRLASTIPNARLVLLEGAAHQPQWDAPDAFHAAVLPFLDRELF